MRLYLAEDVLAELQHEADRLDRAPSWLLQQAWTLSRQLRDPPPKDSPRNSPLRDEDAVTVVGVPLPHDTGKQDLQSHPPTDAGADAVIRPHDASKQRLRGARADADGIGIPLSAQMAVLAALASRRGYGLEVVRRIAARTNGVVRLDVETAYVGIRKLESKKLLRCVEMTSSPIGGRRKYYALTEKGAKVLAHYRAGLLELLLSAEPPAGEPSPMSESEE